jgi:hypothetical protein
MSEWLAFAELGLRHITDPRGADHILFLVALAAAYRVGEWRPAVWVVTAFTVGHSIALALAVTGVLALPEELIEFLIPVTIVATAGDNVLRGTRARSRARRLSRSALAAGFGLVHGAGFASYLRSLFVDDIAMPLLGFNVGLEVGQIVVLALAALGLMGVDRLIAVARSTMELESSIRLRTHTVSAAVAAIALHWAVERAPW